MSRGRPVVYRSIAEISHAVVYIHVNRALKASHHPRESLRRFGVFDTVFFSTANAEICLR